MLKGRGQWENSVEEEEEGNREQRGSRGWLVTNLPGSSNSPV